MKARRWLLSVALAFAAVVLVVRAPAPEPGGALGPPPVPVAAASRAAPDDGPAVAFVTSTPARPAGPALPGIPRPGWWSVARKFSEAFMARVPASRWYAGVRPYVSAHLAQAFRLTDPAMVPAGRLLGLEALDEDTAAATVLARLDGPTSFEVGLAYDGTRWEVTDVDPVDAP